MRFQTPHTYLRHGVMDPEGRLGAARRVAPRGQHQTGADLCVVWQYTVGVGAVIRVAGLIGVGAQGVGGGSYVRAKG